MKVNELKVGQLYRVVDDCRVGGTIGATKELEASRLSLYILCRYARKQPVGAMTTGSWRREPLVYLGRRSVRDGQDGRKSIYQDVHNFARPDGSCFYIHGTHIKHITPFTEG